MEFAEDYPNKPPVVKFVSPMFHPNSEQQQRLLPFNVSSVHRSEHDLHEHRCRLQPLTVGHAAGLQYMLMAAFAWTSCKTSGAPSTMWLQC